MLTDRFGNPSSLHSYGRQAKDILEESCQIVVWALGALKGTRTFGKGPSPLGPPISSTLRWTHLVFGCIFPATGWYHRSRF